MNILAKELDKAVGQNVFKTHPLCSNPLSTHLSFADDVLIFFDGSENSLTCILEILRKFQTFSGLALNLRKSCLFLDGNNLNMSRDLASRFGLVQGSLPVCYLGLPLMPAKLKPEDYQPLIDKILSRIRSWTVRHFSFAGRLQLIQSVLFSIINFWSGIFPLPKACLDKFERIRSSFLWSGVHDSARSAKVSWDAVCGLGLRRLQGLNKIYGLKLIWLLFASNGSLWVAWIEKHVIKGRLFWTENLERSGSWIWRDLIKLRALARPFLSCHLVSGKTNLFLQDDWTSLGPLIEVSGSLDPQVTSISLMAKVSQVG